MSETSISETGNTPGGESLPPEASSSQGTTPPSGETDEYVPEYDAEGKPHPVPYDRFKESRGQLRELRGQQESLQHELQLQRELGQQQQQQLSYYNDLMQRQVAPQPQQQAPQKPEYDFDVGQGSFDDPYADPQDKRIQALEGQLRQMNQSQVQQKQAWQQQQQSFEDYRTQQRQTAIANEIESNLATAMSRYPTENKFWVYDQLMRGQSHDARNLEILAKRSHEETMEGRRQWAAQGGYIPPARPLMSSSSPVATPQSFGDDLELAEAAAIERLRNTS